MLKMLVMAGTSAETEEALANHASGRGNVPAEKRGRSW